MEEEFWVNISESLGLVELGLEPGASFVTS